MEPCGGQKVCLSAAWLGLAWLGLGPAWARLGLAWPGPGLGPVWARLGLAWLGPGLGPAWTTFFDDLLFAVLDFPGLPDRADRSV